MQEYYIRRIIYGFVFNCEPDNIQWDLSKESDIIECNKVSEKRILKYIDDHLRKKGFDEDYEIKLSKNSTFLFISKNVPIDLVPYGLEAIS